MDAKYLLVRLNGFDLAYVKVGDSVVGVHDLEINDEDVLSAAWMDAEFNVGAETAVKVNTVPEVEVLMHEQNLLPKDPEAEVANAPQTDVVLGDAWALVIALISLLGVAKMMWA